MVPPQLRVLGGSAAIILGGFVTINVVSAVTMSVVRTVTERKRKKISLPCMVCKGKGFYICKLCRGNATIQWSPLYDPVAINPCVCPTCEGNRIQRCLNCLGKGYS
ncbi:protein BUNDLE SHEATH DEFECTIVE 2, chloroplastic [Punica granatum]|nr:protein BUNDLE SHEATH DEFECTIVE 2, chloroplastic [Punica granatum]